MQNRKIYNYSEEGAKHHNSSPTPCTWDGENLRCLWSYGEFSVAAKETVTAIMDLKIE